MQADQPQVQVAITRVKIRKFASQDAYEANQPFETIDQRYPLTFSNVQYLDHLDHLQEPLPCRSSTPAATSSPPS